MVFFSLAARSKHLNAELSSKYCGNAKIALDQLDFDSNEEPDKKKIIHLQRVFKGVGCDRLNPNHFISGNISADVLQASLQQSNRNAHDLRSLEPPDLRLPAGQRVYCPSGLHRVIALKKHKPAATWWPVKLYVDLSPEARRALADEFANEGKYSDGEIVVNILAYPEHSVDANQWWARLDKSKPRILKKILRHRELAPAFRKVLQIPGLRPALLLATWNKIFHCVEEVIHYLQLIYNTWVGIMGSETALPFVDNDAVQELELRVPGISYCDERHAEYQIQKQTIFKAVTDKGQRELILQNLKRVGHLIPSIHTLQQDFKYLRPCSHVMRKLISGRDQIPVTVQTTAFHAFGADEGLSFNREARFLTNLKLLYLHIMQNVCQLSGQGPLKDNDNDEDYELLPYDARAWHELAVRAKELGFSSDEILRLYNTDPDREVAIKALYDARPSRYFDYGSNFEFIVHELTKAFKTAKPVESKMTPAELTSHVGERVARRCGRVYSDTYDKDRYYITLDNVTRKVQKNTDITSLFARRSVFHAFWGWQDDQGNDKRNEQGNGRGDDGLDDTMDGLDEDGCLDEGHQGYPGQALASTSNDQGNDQGNDGLDDTMDGLDEGHQGYPGQALASTSNDQGNDQGNAQGNDWDDNMDEEGGLDETHQGPKDQEMRDAEASGKQHQRYQRELTKQKKIERTSGATRITPQEKLRKQRKIQQALTAASPQGGPPEEGQQLIVADARPDGHQPMITSSAQAAFISNPSDAAPHNALSVDMDIYIRENGQWEKTRSCKRPYIENAIEIVRRRNPERQLLLYTGIGRGIALDDCQNYEEDALYLSTNPDEGFPVGGEIL
ncbi:hypothetical protein DL764_005708 [Monosporascus ibericus]|uniref:Uncharacterized protein n=1 Tax=Monosporascus ibericus TaxID=155417 RepID=A0A4Q4T829_9PEZI|nr:hypothetical protein DL764_005708 [Monosporascus ibericus]